ncbi:hypothetical protein F5Y15DRAFT_229894 [Xylariaceae sp. FL0016]|nr:hypothetical protein F5Y15DRAFT_229894 [Xylariaceae sp. FL0016]
MLPNTQPRGIKVWLLGFLICYVLVALHLGSKCYRDPSSAFFRPEHARLLSYSSFRKAQAKEFGDKAALQPPVKWENSTSPDICIGVSSVSRHGFSYLKETLGSVLQGLADVERRRIYLVVFLAHSEQSLHEDYHQPWLVNMADSLPTYPQDAATIGLVQELEAEDSYDAHARKQKIDYSVVLSECAKVQPGYVMTLEDDVIALDGWYHRLMNALEVAVRKTRELGRENFLYLRIFYDDRLLGWNAEEWPTYVSWSIVAVVVPATVLALLRYRFARLRQVLTWTVVFIVCGICVPMLIGLFFASGHSCMMPKSPGVELMPRYGCCAQGLVFPQEQVVDHLIPMYRDTQDTHAAVDTFLEDWAERRDELRWAVTPVLIQHVGGKSTHGAGDQELGRLTDDMPFDYPFELNDPDQLSQEHGVFISSMQGVSGIIQQGE